MRPAAEATGCDAGVPAAPGITSGPATPGEPLWVKRYNGPGNSGDQGHALAVSPDGSTVFVTGYSTGSAGRFDYATAAYSASTGARLWVKRYNGPANGDDVAYGLAVSPDGSTVFVTGHSAGQTSFDDYATVAYRASTGQRLWVNRYNGPGNSGDIVTALGVSPDGSTVFVTGYSAGQTSFDEYATVAYSASTGSTLWARHYNGPGNSDDGASTLGVSPDGSTVFVTGGSTGPTNGLDYATVAYNASTGALLWVTRYNEHGHSADVATGLGVSPDGSTVFVTGYSRGQMSYYDYATVAYSASTGARLWVSRYNGPGNNYDVVTALRVSPDGSAVFVTGASIGQTSGLDYATVAYSIT